MENIKFEELNKAIEAKEQENAQANTLAKAKELGIDLEEFKIKEEQTNEVQENPAPKTQENPKEEVKPEEKQPSTADVVAEVLKALNVESKKKEDDLEEAKVLL